MKRMCRLLVLLACLSAGQASSQSGGPTFEVSDIVSWNPADNTVQSDFCYDPQESIKFTTSHSCTDIHDVVHFIWTMQNAADSSNVTVYATDVSSAPGKNVPVSCTVEITSDIDGSSESQVGRGVVTLIDLEPIAFYVDGTNQTATVEIGGTVASKSTIIPSDREQVWQIIEYHPDDDMPEEKKANFPSDVSIDSDSGVVTVDDDSGTGWVMVKAMDSVLTNCDETAGLTVSCPPQAGDMEAGPESISVKWCLGRSGGKGSAGWLKIWADTPTPWLVQPAALQVQAVPMVRAIYQTLFGSNGLRQALAPECLVDVLCTNEYQYEMRFYRRQDVVEATVADDLIEVVSNAVPFIRYKVENPAGTSNDLTTVRITRNPGSGEIVTEFVYQETNGLARWTMAQGNGLRRESVGVVTNATGRVVTRTVADAAQTVQFKRRTEYQMFDFGERVVREIVDPDGAALVTTFDYYSAPVLGQYGKLRQVIRADGSWERFDYDSEGRKTEVVQTWLDAPANTPASGARVTTYSFTPVDPQDDGSVYANSPRMETEQVLGKIVSRTYRAYYTNASQERVEIEEQAASGSAAYGDPANLRTVRVFHPFGENIESRRIKEITLPNGRHEAYTYENGTWVFAYQPGQSVFTLGAGEYLRTIVIHGTVANPNGIANKSTREVRVENKLGREVMHETFVYTGSDYARVDWTVNELDDFGRVKVAHRANGSKTESVWACCGKESEKDQNGIERVYAYDALQRLEFSKKVGVAAGEYPAQADQITTYTYDAEGRRLTETLSAGSLSQGSTNQYDLVGRQIESTDFAGRRTTTSYSQDGLTVTEIVPGGLVPPSAGFTRITERFKDGQVKSITGTAQVPQFHEYGVNADGTRWTKVYSASDNSPVWVKTTTDLLGRPVKVEKPGYLTTEVMENFYNSKNQLVKQSTAHGPQSTVTLFAYDELGNQIRSGLDINANGSLDLDGIDRITETDTSYDLMSGVWYLTSVNRLYATDNSAATITSSITREQLTGLAGGTRSVVSVFDALGNETITTTAIDRNAKRVTQTTDVPDSSANVVSITVNGLLVSAQRSTLSVPRLYAYDALGRQTSALQGGPGAPRTVGTYTHYDSRGWIDYTEDAAGNRTIFTYDPATGRRLSQFNALTGSTYWAYTALGEVEKTWGSAAYPVSYEYDSYNRRVKQHTYRNGAGWSGPTWPVSPGDSDETTWTYHEATGLPLSKTDDAGKSVSYTYDSANRPATRIWSRVAAVPSNGTPLVTSYSYSPAGDLTGIDYSDPAGSGAGSTPDVSFTYDRFGRQKTAESSVSSHAFAYNGLLLDSETIVSSSGTNIIDRSYDGLGRATGFTMGADYSVVYGYDSYGRFSSVSSSVQSVSSVDNYSYLPNSDLIETLTTVNGLQSTRSYEPHRNLLTQIKNSVDNQTISQFDYANDALGRRISAGWSGSAFSEIGPTVMKYGYNTRSEVINAERFFGSDPLSPGAPVAGQNWDYDFDPIGNRKTAARDGDTEIYTANNLNQYTERTVSAQTHLAGTAAEDAVVTINRPSISGITVEPVTRQGAYFHKKLSLDNSAQADVEDIAVVGVLGGAHSTGSGQVDIVSTYSGVVWAAQSPERFSYDADGNTLTDAVRKYEWDGENRLIAVTVSNVVDGALTRVEFSYDYMSRRSSKKVYSWSAASNEFQISSFSTFLYDGWNLIKEISTTEDLPTGLPASRVVDYYVWGLDLSGSLQGAGGIGGLLGRIRKEERFFDDRGLLLICHRPPGNPENCNTLRINASAWPAHEAHGDTLGSCDGGTVSSFLYAYDANGNVSELLNPQSAIENRQFIMAHYEYSPFGETIVSTGPEADDNPFRFSTKYFVDELGIGDWGMRWYVPPLGRWLSQDPIAEEGGINLYLFVNNLPIISIDYLGQVWVKTDSGLTSRRTYQCDCKDKVRALADELSLSPNDFALWLKAAGDSQFPSTADEPIISKNRTYTVPNTVAIDFGSGIPPGVLYFLWTMAYGFYAESQSQGYLVEVYGTGEIASGFHMNGKDLIKYGYFGHGAGGSILPYYGVGNSGPFAGYHAGRYSHHKLAYVQIIACDSYDGEYWWKQNVSAKGTLRTVDGSIFFSVFPPRGFTFKTTNGAD